MTTKIEEIILHKINEHLRDKGCTQFDVIPYEEIILDSDLDSMDMAILIAELDTELGFDPFVEMNEPVYPETFKDFLGIYLDYKQKP